MIDISTREQLISEYSALITRLCVSLCKNTYDAQDLFQETWLKFLTSDFVYKDDAGARTYLIRICVNAYKSFYNARKRRREDTYGDEKREYIENIPDRGSDVQEFDRLYDAVGHLSYRNRTVISLCYFEDLSEQEISKVLGIPSGSVKSRLHNAKKALRKELNK